MVTSFIHPHDPYVARPEWWNMYDHDEIDLPKHRFEREDQDPFSQRLMDGIEASTVAVTDDEIKNARHGYYANTSYFDSKIGELVQTLEEAELLDNTIIIVTADHGDMLGERGLWYKMNFFEHSTRVPFVVAGPGVARGVTDKAMSLVDLLPTFLDLAETDNIQRPDLGVTLDGRSLLPLMKGEDDISEAIGEYCAEMTGHPVFMIRRNEFKYVHCDSDPPQLYNIAQDPLELTNLVDDSDHRDLAQAFAQEVLENWDGEGLRQAVIATQKQRRAIYQAMVKDGRVHWDYNPPREASQEYVRNHMDWTVAAETNRFPPPKRS